MAVGDVTVNAGGGVPSWVSPAAALAANYPVLANNGGVPTWTLAAVVGAKTVRTVSASHLPCWAPLGGGAPGPDSTVWVLSSRNTTIYRFNPDGGPYPGGVLSGNGMYNPQGLGVAGTEVWVTNYNDSSLSRFNASNGSSAGSNIPSDGSTYLNNPYGICTVGTEIWVTNRDNDTISRFNLDGTVFSGGWIAAGFNGLSGPAGICTVGTEVWVTNLGGSTISRFNASNGSSAGSVLTGNGLDIPYGICTVGTEVWVTNRDGNSISRFNASDGSSAGSVLTGNGLATPYGIGAVDAQVWVANANYSNQGISRFNASDGSSAGSVLNPALLNVPIGLAVLPPGTDAGNAGGSWAGDVCTTDNELVCLLTFSTNNATPAAGANVTIDVTVSADVGPTSWYILIMNEVGDVVGGPGGSGVEWGAIDSAASGTTHTYTAYLSTSGSGISSDAVATGPLTVTWT